MAMQTKADAAEARAARAIVAAFRHALARARARVDRPALVAAIARGDRFGAQAVANAALGAEFLAVEAAWGHAAADAGRLAADEASDLPTKTAQNIHEIIPVSFRDYSAPVAKRLTFNPFAPATSNTLSRWAQQLRLSLEAFARRAIAAAIDRFTGRADPERAADAAIAAMGLSERDVLWVSTYRDGLENGDRAALRRALRDARNDPYILRHFREGTPLPPEYVDKVVANYARKLQAGREALIGRTEALRARWTGVQALWDQTVQSGAVAADEVVKRWHHRGDHKVRATHRSIPIIQPEGVRVDQLFKTSAGNLLSTPGDPSAPAEEVIGCRCFLSYVVRAEALAA